MHKRKYTKEQLEFYFKDLMSKIKKVPREEDLAKYEGYPSVKAYVDRFGSWQNAVNMFADFELAKRKCLNCGSILVKRKKTQKYCSDMCAKTHYLKKSTRYTKATENKIREILDNKCFRCDFDTILEIHSLDNKRESNAKILKAYNKRDLHGFVLLCPNHHQMIHKKHANLSEKDGHLVWTD